MRNPYLSLVLPAAALLTGCASTSPGGDGAWRSLFNGEDLTGWVVKCAPGDESTTFWKVDDGAIRADSMGCKKHDYVWLVTEKEYADFSLKLRFQAYRDSPGNSGVQIRSRYDDASHWLDGPQIDINPPGPWRTGMIWDETRGSSRWLAPDVPKGKWVNESMAAKGLKLYYADERAGWNDLDISAIGPHIRVTLNGLRVTEYDGSAVFGDTVHREHNVGIRGHIALQIHRNDQLRIRFKDISIRELSSPQNRSIASANR